ncbi:DUF3237 domain-containing protein [Spirosoma flavum]|uniref:UPF0311 protein ACFS25_14035 n=1 Tax=Spirosoma flavum TaxID=2048557 RepID=A0ABW6AL54_9BACT
MKNSVLSPIGLLICLLVCQPSFQVLAQKELASTGPQAPQLEFVCELHVKIAPAMVVGETPHGTRRIIPITGRTFSGPNMKGTIINGGADWQILRKDGTTELSALYTLQTDDGVLIYVNNKGIRTATPEVARRIANGEKVSPNDYYFRAAPTFETPPGKYEWLTQTLFISKGIRDPDGVIIQVWKIL